MSVRKQASKTATPEATTTEATTPEVTTPEATPEAIADTLTREATEHAAWLTKVRDAGYSFRRSSGVCSGGLAAFMKDVGIPYDENKRSNAQPAITATTHGIDPAWLTPEGQAGMLQRDREARQAQRDKIARAILRVVDVGYMSSDTADAYLTEFGLSAPPKQVNGQIYLSHLYFEGLPEGTTRDQVTEAFGRVLSAAVGTYLPGWQHPKVTGFEVSTNSVYVKQDDSDNWSF